MKKYLINLLKEALKELNLERKMITELPIYRMVSLEKGLKKGTFNLHIIASSMQDACKQAANELKMKGLNKAIVINFKNDFAVVKNKDYVNKKKSVSENQLEVIPPEMPSHVRFRSKAQGSKKDLDREYDIALFTQKEAEEFAEIIKKEFLNNYQVRKSVLDNISNNIYETTTSSAASQKRI